MRVYRVYNTITTVDGRIFLEECGVFASQVIADMVQKALDAYNLELMRLADGASDNEVVDRQAITEPLEVNESLESIEKAFKTLQKKMDAERGLYEKEQV